MHVLSDFKVNLKNHLKYPTPSKNEIKKFKKSHHKETKCSNTWLRLTFYFSRYCLTTSFHMFLGCPLAKLPPTSNFQYILGQELSSISILSIFKIIKNNSLNQRKRESVLALSLQIRKMTK